MPVPLLECLYVPLLPGSLKSRSLSTTPTSSCGVAVLQSGARWPGVGEGAGVGGEAGAEGSKLPGITLGFTGMDIGMEGDGVVCMGRGMDRGMLPLDR